MANPLHVTEKRWDSANNKIIIGWDPEDCNDRYIWAFAVRMEQGKLVLDRSSFAQKDLRNEYGPDMFTLTIPLKEQERMVERRLFLMFSSDTMGIDYHWVEEILGSARSEDPFFVDVVTGHAQVEYTIERKKDRQTESVMFSLYSDMPVAEGVLGYEYQCGTVMIRMPFPGYLQDGKQGNSFGPILVPLGTFVSITQMEGQNISNVMIRERVKKSLFGRRK